MMVLSDFHLGRWAGDRRRLEQTRRAMAAEHPREIHLVRDVPQSRRREGVEIVFVLRHLRNKPGV